MLRTLTRKVTLIALTFLSLFLVAAGFAIASISIIRDAANHLSEHTIEQVELSGHFNTDMFRGLAEALSFARTHALTNRESALQELSDAKDILEQLRPLETELDPYAPELTPNRIQLQN